MKIIYRCDYCNTIGTEDEIQAHEASCLHNPDNRCCLSCKYYVERGFKWEPQCTCLQGNKINSPKGESFSRPSNPEFWIGCEKYANGNPDIRHTIPV